MRKWKAWEAETASLEYQFSNGKLYILLKYIHAIKTFTFENFCALNVDLSYYSLADPSRFRFTHQTSFARRHQGLSSTTGIRWIVRHSSLPLLCNGNIFWDENFKQYTCNIHEPI